jgi:valyl-tRNA synthetase
LQGFLKSVNAKLTNERFMSNAKPEIIAIEQKKKDDAEAKLKIIEDRLSGLAG